MAWQEFMSQLSLAAWVILGEFFLILVLLFLLWRHGRWLVRINNRLSTEQEAVISRLSSANTEVTTRLTKLVYQAIDSFTSATQEEKDEGTEE